MTCPGDTATLGDIAEFIRGITFKPDDVVPSGTSGSVRCMRTKNVQAEIDLSDVWSVDSRFVKRVNQYLQTGDLLVSSANNWNLMGKCCWVPEEARGSTFGGFISALRPNRERVDPRYLLSGAQRHHHGRRPLPVPLHLHRSWRARRPLPGGRHRRDDHDDALRQHHRSSRMVVAARTLRKGTWA